jgi:hypothetical protein
MSLNFYIVKWQSLYVPLVGPQKDDSKVKEFIS